MPLPEVQAWRRSARSSHSNADDSGIPGVVIRYRVKNAGNKAVEVSIAGSLANAVGYDGVGRVNRLVSHDPRGAERHREKTRTALTGWPCPRATYKTRGGAHSARWRSLTPYSNVTCLRIGSAAAGGTISIFWDDFAADGRLEDWPRSRLARQADRRRHGSASRPRSAPTTAVSCRSSCPGTSPTASTTASGPRAARPASKNRYAPHSRCLGGRQYLQSPTSAASRGRAAPSTTPSSRRPCPPPSSTPSPARPRSCARRPASGSDGGTSSASRAAATGRLLPGQLHPRLELRAGARLPLPGARADDARDGVPQQPRARRGAWPSARSLPLGSGVLWSSSRPPTGRWARSSGSTATGSSPATTAWLQKLWPQAKKALDYAWKSLGRRPRRRHGGRAAQHLRHRVLRPEHA